MIKEGEKIEAYKILAGRLEEMRHVGKPVHTWNDNVKGNLKKWVCGLWPGLICLRTETSITPLNFLMNLQLQYVGNFLTSPVPLGFSKRQQLVHWSVSESLSYLVSFS